MLLLALCSVTARKFDHVMSLLRDLHWLCVPGRLDFRFAVLVYRCLHGTAPAHQSCELRRVTDCESRRRLRSASTATLIVPSTFRSTIGETATVHFPSSRTASRTVCAVTSGLPMHAEDCAARPLLRHRSLNTDDKNDSM